MSDKKKSFNWMWGWPVDLDECKEQWEDFKSNVDTFWDQMQKMQDTNQKIWKDYWNKAFPLYMEMQDNFVSTLPEKVPTPPGMPPCPVTPKEVMGKVKEFQETANEHMKEQVDNAYDFRKKAQEQARTIITETVKNIEENLDKKQNS